MATKEDKIFIIYVIIFVIIAIILSNYMFLEKGPATVTTHGIEICNKNYECGSSDGICPEKFGATCIIKDPDCR